MSDQNLDNNPNDHDEAMEWISEWEYERNGPSGSGTGVEDAAAPAPLSSFYGGANGDDASIAMDEDDDDESVEVDDDAPLPLDHPIDPHHESSQEIAIFWTRANEELTDDDLTEMFDLAHHTHALGQALNGGSRRNSRNSLVSLMETQPPRDDDEDSIMGPLQDKEGLLPPMSPSHLYQPPASFGLTVLDVHKVAVGPAFPSDSMATHTTVDLMDDDQSDDGFEQSSVSGVGDGGILERQQRLLQQVLEQAPASAAAMRERTQLPQPSDHQRKLLQEMKSRNKPPDQIFARQQEIFQQMRVAERAKIQPETNHFYAPTYSPVSVTRTLTRAGMDSEEYHRVVARLTQKNLIERQRVLLQQSMKRSLETRQALHIKPTALPDYNHDKLSQVLKDIESSSRSISETYGRR